MHLLVVVLNRPDKLEELLEGYIEHEIPGATIVDSVGMGSVLGREIPIFAGFRSMFQGSQPSGKILFSLIDNADKVDEALDFIDHAMNPEGQPPSALAFVAPVSHVRGGRTRTP
jgi:nitrogen regulatory protein PII